MLSKITYFLLAPSVLFSISGVSAYTEKELNSAYYLSARKVIDNQTDNALYRLDDGILRQEVAKVIVNASKTSKNNNCQGYYKDLKADAINGWACSFVETLADKKIVIRQDYYRPEDYTSKAETLALVLRTIYPSTYERYTELYKQVRPNVHWSVIAISLSKKLGILTEEIKAPNDIASRGFVFNVLSAAMKKNDVKIPKETQPVIMENNPTLTNNDIVTFSYSFPDGWYAGLQKFAGEVSKLNIPGKFGAVVSVPKGTWPFPIAFIFHWAGPDCIWPGHQNGFNEKETYISAWEGVCPDAEETIKNLPSGIEDPYNYYWPSYSHNYMGLTYLTQALSRKGVVAVAFDANIQNNIWLKKGDSHAMENALDVFKRHSQLLKNINNGENQGIPLGTALKGKIDFNNVYFVGHSNGGVAAYIAGTTKAIDNVKGIVAIQPGGYDPEEETTKNTNRIPLLVIRGGCDEQLGQDTGLYLIEREQQYGSKVAYDILLKGVWHGDVNTLWKGRDCKDGTPASKELTREQVEEMTAEATSSFIQSKNKNFVSLPKFAEYSTTTKTPVKTVETTGYQYISPKSVKNVASTQKILDEMPSKEDIGKWEF